MVGSTREPPPKHAWSSATEVKNAGLTSVSNSNDDAGSSSVNAAPVITVDEAERLIENLEETPVEEVGGNKFLKRHTDLERLNLQAHQSAQGKTDEFVLEAFLTFDKVRGVGCVGSEKRVGQSRGTDKNYQTESKITPKWIKHRSRRKTKNNYINLHPFHLAQVKTIIKDLLAIEAWRESVLPKLIADVAANNNVMRVYFTLYHEATLVNLLEVMLFHKHVIESLGELSVELVDYCSRRMAVLAVPLSHNDVVSKAKATKTAAEISEHIDKRTREQEIMDHRNDIEFKIGVAATTMARYLCEHFEALPLSAQTRVLDTHDFIVMMVPLVEEPPWTRRNGKGEWEKLGEGARWNKVERADLLKLTKCEAQIWLSVYHLTCTEACREKYGLNTFRKEQLLRLRKYLNDVVLDQLPVLADVMRYMDELALMSVPENGTGNGSALMMQQVAVERDKITRGKNWSDVAKKQYEEIWSKVTDAKDDALRNISDIYNEEGTEDILGEAKPFEVTSQEIESVVLEVEGGGKKGFRVNKGEEGTQVETPEGKFRRLKLIPVSIEGGGDSGVEILYDDEVLESDCKINAVITFTGEIPHAAMLTLEKAGLIRGEKASVAAKCWKQIGSVSEKLVCQIGFERCRVKGAEGEEGGKVYGYKISDTAFVSQPIWEQIDLNAFH